MKVDLDNTIMRIHVRHAVDVSCDKLKAICQEEKLQTAVEVFRFFKKAPFCYLLRPGEVEGEDSPDSDEEDDDFKTTAASPTSSSSAASESKKRKFEPTPEDRLVELFRPKPEKKKCKIEDTPVDKWLERMAEFKTPFRVIVAHGSTTESNGLEEVFQVDAGGTAQEALRYLGATSFTVLSRSSFDCIQELSDRDTD